MEDRLARYAVVGITVLVGIGYMVWLSVLYLKFMETDAFLRVTILEHYGEQLDGGESDTDNPVDNGSDPDTDVRDDVPNRDSVDADGGPAVESSGRRAGASSKSGQNTRRNALPNEG